MSVFLESIESITMQIFHLIFNLSEVDSTAPSLHLLKAILEHSISYNSSLVGQKFQIHPLLVLQQFAKRNKKEVGIAS